MRGPVRRHRQDDRQVGRLGVGDLQRVLGQHRQVGTPADGEPAGEVLLPGGPGHVDGDAPQRLQRGEGLVGPARRQGEVGGAAMPGAGHDLQWRVRRDGPVGAEDDPGPGRPQIAAAQRAPGTLLVEPARPRGPARPEHGRLRHRHHAAPQPQRRPPPRRRDPGQPLLVHRRGQLVRRAGPRGGVASSAACVDTVYTGPVAAALGIDLALPVGLLAASGVYAAAMRAVRRQG